MTREQLLDLQKQRSEQFGIEVLSTPEARLSFPSRWPRKWSAVADPVNIRYRIDGDGYLRAARARFKATASVYKQEESRRIVHTRIVQRMLRRGMRVSIDPEDALDALLPARIRRQNTRGVEPAPGDLRTLALTVRRAADLPPEAEDGSGVENFVIEATVATNAVITRFTKSGEPEIIERKALDSIGRWLTTKYRTMFLDHDRGTRVGRVLEYWIEDVDTGESTAQLVIRALVSATRGDLQQQIREGTLFQLSVWFGVPAGSAKREWSDKLKCYVWRFLDAEGYEASLVGMAVDPGATIRQFAVARAVGGAAEGARQLLEIGFEIARATGDEPSGIVRFPADGLDPEMLGDLAGTLRGAPIFGGFGDEIRGRIDSAEVRDGGLDVRFALDAPAAQGGVAVSPPTIVIRGVAHLESGRAVGLSFDHAELSDDSEERGFKEIGMSEKSTASVKPERGEAYKRINELLVALKGAADEEAAGALRGELDEVYSAIALDAGERLPHPLSAGFDGEYPWAPVAPAAPVDSAGAAVSEGNAATPPPDASSAAVVTDGAPAAATNSTPAAAPEAPAPAEPPAAAADGGAFAPARSVKRSVTDRDFEQLWEFTANLACFLGMSPELDPKFREQLFGVVARLRELLTPSGVPVEPLEPMQPQVARAVEAAIEGQRAAIESAMNERLKALETALTAARARADELAARVQHIERSPLGAPPNRDHSPGQGEGAPPPAGLSPEQWNAFAMKNRKPSQPGTAA